MTKRVRGALTMAAVAVGLVSSDLSAQDLSWAFGAEAGGDEVYVLFGQPSLAFGTVPGLRPILSLGAHYVILDGGNSWGLTPTAGLRYQTSGGMIQGNVGWAIRGNERSFDVFGGSKSGLHTGVHTEFWGDGSWGLQGIANYNWGSDFLWSRARLTKRIAQRSSGGGVSLGGELVWQTQTDDDDLIAGNEYEATYIGPVLQLSTASGMNWAFSGGWKHTQPGDNSTWYAKVELALP